VSKERDFIYRRPFVCVCTLINKNALILNKERRHMDSNVTSQIQFYDTTSTSTSTTPHHFWTTKMRHNRKATIKLHITSGQHRWDKWLAGRWASVKVETSYKVRLQIVVEFCILTMLLMPQSHWHVVSHFNAMRRVRPSSSCCYFCFDTVSSFPCRNSPFRHGYRSTALMYIYFFVYDNI